MSADLVLKQIKLGTKTRKHIKSNLTLSAFRNAVFFSSYVIPNDTFCNAPPAPKQLIIKFTHASARGKFILVLCKNSLSESLEFTVVTGAETRCGL